MPYLCQDCLKEFEVPLVRGGEQADSDAQVTCYYVCPNCECENILEIQE